MPVEIGHPLRWELIGFLGEPLLQAAAAMVEGKSVADTKVETLLVGLSGLFSRLDPRFVLRLQQTFINVTQYRSAGNDWIALAKTWPLHFAGKYHELDALTWAHLRANYLSFLDDSEGWRAFLRVGQRALSGATSPGTSPSTGTSGASSVATNSA
ncbi:MAG TPA: hypothetical protein VGO53_16085 [Steroidobacteraceae bacterium]|nr:hypothetical protein [Steroidobacteraceae bacterium]